MAGYTPGEQPEPGAKVIKLNTNENPYPPSPKVFEAIRSVAADSLRRYPQPMADDFRRWRRATTASRLRTSWRVTAATTSCRSRCAATAARATCSSCPDPTYSLYPVLAELADVRLVPVPWEPGWSLPTDALLSERAARDFFRKPQLAVGNVEWLSRISRRWQRGPRRSCSWTKRTPTLPMTTA